MNRRLGQSSVLLLAAIAIIPLGCGPDVPSAANKSERSSASTSPALMVPRNDFARSGAGEKEHYAPRPADFRTIYERDMANKARQEWNEYYSWVTTFYSGNLFESGWTKRAASILEGLRSAQVQDELRASLNELSKLLAAEWAKDNGIRKVDNSDLRRVGSRFLEAKAKDDGTGAVIRKEIAAIRTEIESRFRR